jgi:hypothetical protein
MKSISHTLTIFISVIILSACGTTQIALQLKEISKVQSIALIRVEEPAAYVGADWGNPGAMFGAIGGAFVGSSTAKTSKRINEITTEQNLKAGDRFTTLLSEKLSKIGYKVSLISIKREKPTKLLNDYTITKIDSADAILDIVIESIGYSTENAMTSSHWRPSSQIKVALVENSNKNVIYQEKFMYGYHNPFMSGTDIESPEEYHFKNKEELFTSKEKLIEGIITSIETVAEEIASRLSKPSL